VLLSPLTFDELSFSVVISSNPKISDKTKVAEAVAWRLSKLLGPLTFTALSFADNCSTRLRSP
jgi:hypothetical protein